MKVVIPVYEVSVPEYNVRVFKENSPVRKYKLTPHFDINIPEIYEKNKPDFVEIGKKIDACLKNHFFGKTVIIRTLSSQEHENKTVDQLITIIKNIGHDRYDPERKGDRYTNIENKQIEIFAMPAQEITREGEYFRYLIEPFYYWPIHDRGCPVRIDIAIVYDSSKLIAVEHQYKGREGEIKKDGFCFKYPSRKSDAILGIIKIN